MTETHFTLPKTNAGPWQNRPFHRQYLMRQANNLFDFFEANSLNPKGGFFDLDDNGRPVQTDNAVRQIHSTTRMIHCAAIGSLIGEAGEERGVGGHSGDLALRSREIISKMRRYTHGNFGRCSPDSSRSARLGSRRPL